MGCYKTLIDIGFRKMNGHGILLVISLIVGALYGRGMMLQDWASSFGLLGMITVLIVSMMVSSLVLYAFILVPLRALFFLREIKREFGEATVRDLWAHYANRPDELFDITQAAVQNGDYFRDYKACKKSRSREKLSIK